MSGDRRCQCTRCQSDAPVADPISEEAFDGPCPDPIDLFTVLYGIYPCNFVAFLKDANGYLRSKDWKNTSGFSVASGMVRERSNVSHVESSPSIAQPETEIRHVSPSFVCTRFIRRC